MHPQSCIKPSTSQCAFVALGANLGDAVCTVQAAIQALAEHPQLKMQKVSSLYQSPPWQAYGPDYINAVVALQTALVPLSLLQVLQTLELHFGRKRLYRNAPRTLDLDLLLYGKVALQTDALTLPHPRMTERAFVLVPLAEIAPDLVSPQALQRVAGQQLQKL